MKDPYTLPNGTLKNKLGITEYNELKKAECDIGFVKLISLDEVALDGFGADTLKALHKHIFEDIFDWAGEYRKVPVYKTEVIIPGISLEYEQPKKIENAVNRVLKEMNEDNWNPNDIEEYTSKLVKYSAKLWRIHPFRDGNTRTTLAFAYRFAKEHGVDLDMAKILGVLTRKVDKDTGRIKQYSVRDKFVIAALDEKDLPEPEHLERLFRSAILTDSKSDLDDR